MTYFLIGLVIAASWYLVVWGSCVITILYQYLFDKPLDFDKTWWVVRFDNHIRNNREKYSNDNENFLAAMILFGFPALFIVAWPLALFYIILRTFRYGIRWCRVLKTTCKHTHTHPDSVKIATGTLPKL